jgi:mevalonate kinase
LSQAPPAEAFGKVILVGEHAVVYGTPAIALGVGTAARASVLPAARASLRLGARDVVLARRTGAQGDGTPEERAFAALLDALQAPNVAAEVQLCLPAGVGLGASAALAVALARAVARVSDAAAPEDAARILRAAQAWENVFHGNASGIDAAAAYHGGCLRFTRAQGSELLSPAQPLHVAVAVAGPAASTRRMVEGVAERKRREPARVEALIADIAAIVAHAERALAAGEHGELGRLLDENHAKLGELGVSTPELDRACAAARRAGAHGPKLTGGGGGGGVRALCEPGGVEPVLQSYCAHGLACFSAVVGER